MSAGQISEAFFGGESLSLSETKLCLFLNYFSLDLAVLVANL